MAERDVSALIDPGRHMRFLKVPLHPMLVHFPVALLSVSLLWDGVGLVTAGSVWWALSFWSLVVGLLAALPAAATGLVDYANLSVETSAGSVATRHLLFTGAAITAYLVSLLIRQAPDPLQGRRLVAAVASSAVGLGLLAVGGHLGALLVYEYGVGGSTDDGDESG